MHLSVLQYDAKHAPAVAQVFSRVLLCRNLEVAAKYAEEEVARKQYITGNEKEKTNMICRSGDAIHATL